jgi:hypothetical protein
MRISKFLLCYTVLLAIVSPAMAQVRFSTVVNEKKYGKNEVIQVDYLVENATSIGTIAAPGFKGFTVVSGPMQQSGMSVVNGATTKYEGITYFLKPVSAGKFTIDGASAVVDGKPLRSNTVQVTITNASTGNSNNPAFSNPFSGYSLQEETTEVDEEYVLKAGEIAAEKIKNNLFVKLDVNKTSCYTGEPVIATYRLFSRLRSESKVTRRPSLSQFSVYDMVQPEANGPSIEKINGKLYNAHIIRKVQLYPLQDGVFDLEPVELENTVQFLRLEGSNNKASLQQMMEDYMNGIRNGRVEEQKITLESKPLTITVKPLPPTGRPVDFDGAVGKFSITADIPQAAVTANETAVLNVLLKGEGNLPLINAPQVNWPSGVEGFEPAVKEMTDKTIAPITGTKLFEFGFTVKQAGTVTIPPVSFSYFDPTANSYKHIQTDAILLNVKKGINKPAQQKKVADTAGKGPGYKLFLWLLLFAAFAAIVIFFKQKKKASTPASTMPPQTNPATVPAVADQFEAAKLALAAVNSQLFYRETGKAVWSLLTNKFNLTSSQLNKPVVIRLLKQANAAPGTIQLLDSVLNECELALYTPVHTENSMRHTLEKAEHLEQELQAISC